MPSFRALLIFFIVLFVALSTNPHEQSFREYARFRILPNDRKTFCSDDGICLHGAGFERIFEPMNSGAKFLLGYDGTRGTSEKFFFRGTDCVFFTVVHATGKLSGVYLGIFNTWIALPQPYLIRTAFNNGKTVLYNWDFRPRIALLQSLSFPHEERILAALYVLMTVLYYLKPRTCETRLLWSRESMNRGQLWKLFVSFFAHRSMLSTIRSVAVVVFFGPSLLRMTERFAFWGILIAGALFASILSLQMSDPNGPVFLGACGAYGVLISLCILKPGGVVRIPILETTHQMSVRVFDALMMSVVVELVGISTADGLVAASSAVASWAFTQIVVA